ncbi:hypothetical protein TRVA0_020S00298 [Trichomonascus vanleenenianus]|uniref:uncharacterized protein n=1 Tax=Trichomonascus vanleenenianus TaxID=2268995 RepID=UPI003ECB3025
MNIVPKKSWLLPSDTQLEVALAESIIANGETVVMPMTPVTQDLQARLGEKCILVGLDTKSKRSCTSGIATALTMCERIDVVVNTTGQTYCGAIEDLEEVHLVKQFDQTFHRAVNLMEAIVPVFRRQDSGHIINVTDIHGIVATPSLGVVSAAMHALESYTESIALELVNTNIKLTVVETAPEVTLLTNPHFIAETSQKYANSMTSDALALLSSGNVFPAEAFEHAIVGIQEIAGIQNPPGRLLAGPIAAEQVKDRLQMASEELDDI